MKICLICGATSAARASSCDQCGEASWHAPLLADAVGVVWHGEHMAEALPDAALMPQDGAAEPEDGPVEAPAEGAPTDTPRVPRRRRVPPS